MTALRPARVPAPAVVEVSPEDPRSIELISEVQAVYAGLYGGPDDSPIAAHEFEPPSGTFLLALSGNSRSIGCIGVRRHEERVGEIKRMYIRPEHRRQGHARALLAAAEDRARELGFTALVLETGEPQPEAMALYESHGYRPIPGFGHYRCAPLSRSFGREL
ncbi:MAG: GNAT family N-acetyltransferase [Actinomycetota bacterium]|nr:GNAT family N-acetyltransferase [Actinomycetota bacterium]